MRIFCRFSLWFGGKSLFLYAKREAKIIMKKQKWIPILLLLAGQTATAQNPLQLPHGKETQRVAQKLTDTQHYFGSSTLKPTTRDAKGANLKDANALISMSMENVDEVAVQLVNAYFLNEPRT
jgi:hypothetical protein